jgi:hypothetical protein
MIKNPQNYYNRIILVGNGFDLAAGLRTRFSDFFLDLLKDLILNDNKRVNYQFQLLATLSSQQIKLRPGTKLEIKNSNSIAEIVSILNNLNITIYSDFELFRALLNNACVNWVNFESEYFHLVKKHFKSHNDTPYKMSSTDLRANVGKLNSCMKFLEDDLKNYLLEEQKKILNSQRQNEIASFLQISFETLALRHYDSKNLQPEWRHIPPLVTTFVNFNYTNALSILLQKTESTIQNYHIDQINIHGSINEPDNPIIFGYGDDTSEDYKKMELIEEDTLLDRIKSFQYPRTGNYHKLLGILEQRPYEIFLYGHSCGLTDKTMLNTLFEHDNCFSIKNFHHNGETSDFKKRLAISRHFNDKKKMRERLVQFDVKATFPSESK